MQFLGSCNRQISKRNPKDSCHWVFIPLCNPLPLSVGWTWWLVCNSQNVAVVVGCHSCDYITKVVTSVFLVDSFAGLDDASCLGGKAFMEKNWVKTVGQAACKELDPFSNSPWRAANNHWVSWKWILPQLKLDCSFRRDSSRGRPQLSHVWILSLEIVR